MSTDAATADGPPQRSLRLGIVGPVGTGKSTLVATICRQLAGELQIAVLTNDIYTDEDARMLRAAGVLPVERIRAVETGACPHTAIRDDVTTNLLAVEDLEADFDPLDLVLVESGGDNLTAALEVTEPAGTIAYSARGGSADWCATIRVAAGGALLWDGAPFVVAAGAAVRREVSVDLEAGAVALLRDQLIFGRGCSPTVGAGSAMATGPASLPEVTTMT